MKYFVALLLSAVLFVACGDESSSSAPDPIGEISSSSNDDNGSSGKDKDASSSSQKDSKKSSSSAAEKNSSSSVSGKNSSSSVPNPVSSSEESFSGTPCEKDEEGYTVFISQEQVKYICQNGFWIPMSSSSVVQQSSSSKYYDMSKQFNANLSYGEFTDPRDNHVYKTIRLFDDVVDDTLTFFAENLNYGKMIFGGEQQSDSTKYCYDDDPWYCENGWGALYTWAAAMAFPSVCDSARMGSAECPNKTDLSRNTVVPNTTEYVLHQGICPDGWHIMNRGEWVAAIDGHGPMSGSQYLSSEIWNGIMENPRGFSLLPAGALDEHGEFSEIMNQAFHWLPEDSYDKSSGLSKGAFTRATSSNLYRGSGNGFVKTAGFSIRCVKDY
ncbi:FISUMP domain-containing protein [Fibrobacter sp.]|uniref:FISUMP domain-containing protein n=1 Tax=Fibrobacter sp. TaxID=35828 RepID=UPI00389077F9